MDRRAAKEILHLEAWLVRVTEIVERGQEAYLNDAILQEAGDSLMIKVGEAANRLSRMSSLPIGDFDWAIAVANRNFLVHQYDEINRHMTWLTLSRDLANWRISIQVLIDQALQITSEETP